MHFNEWLAPGGTLVVLACGHYLRLNRLVGKLEEIEKGMEKDPAGAHG